MYDCSERQMEEMKKIYFNLIKFIVWYSKKEEIDRNEIFKYIKGIVDRDMGICGMYDPILTEEEIKTFEKAISS